MLTSGPSHSWCSNSLLMYPVSLSSYITQRQLLQWMFFFSVVLHHWMNSTLSGRARFFFTWGGQRVCRDIGHAVTNYDCLMWYYLHIAYISLSIKKKENLSYNLICNTGFVSNCTTSNTQSGMGGLAWVFFDCVFTKVSLLVLYDFQEFPLHPSLVSTDY